MERTDVLIVGAGLAGLQASRLLARRGHKVVLVDRKSRLDEAVHTTGIFVRRTLEDFWLPPECLGPPVSHVRLYSPGRRSMMLTSPHEEYRVGRMGPLYRRMLEEALAAKVDWRGNTTFVSSEPMGDGSRVELDSPAGRTSLLARFVMGADGANSRVARQLGLDENREWIVGVEEVYEDIPLLGPPCLHCFIDPQLAPGYIAWIAHDGGEVHLGVGGYARRFSPHDALAKFRREAETLMALDQGRLVEQRGGRIPVGGVLPNIVNSRGLLVGDASGAVSPLTAGGLDPCMRQSALAAGVVHRYLATRDVAQLSPYRGGRLRRRFAIRRGLRIGLTFIRHRWVGEVLFAGLCRFPLKFLAQHVFLGEVHFPWKRNSSSSRALVRIIH
ncbi:MAG: NAD(P)/FAD-dependent oxidoreductase [Pirellulaceae bacterium]|jgi:flavin-dependent dehydrogenase|nr:NAD(P)/FAD-dependent oxidoreductase [Pirellulaceae bacterium]HJN13175.1 NAD(P)/FAD-dependent oxidoreductase [Pirellulaceae bacterium]